MVLLPKEKKQKNYYFSILETLTPLLISYIVVGLSQNGFLSLIPFVSEEFALTRVQISYYSTIYFISAALLSIFSGTIIDKFGPNKSILWGMSCRGIALFLYGLSYSYHSLLFFTIFAGMGMSIIPPSVIKGTTIAVPPEKCSFYLGIVQSGLGVGSIAGTILLPILAKFFNWRLSIQSSALITLITVFFIYIFYKERNINKDIIDSKNNTVNISIRQNILFFKEKLLAISKNKSLFRICILGTIFGTAEGSVCTHFTMYLSEDLCMSKIIAGLGFAVIYIGGIIGSIGLGWVSDNFFIKNRRINLFLIGSFISTMFLIFGILSNGSLISPLIIIILSLFLGSAIIGWQSIYFVVIRECAGEKHIGTATGLSLLFIRTGIFLAPIGFGYIADLKGSYQYSWLFFGILIIIVSTMFLSEK